jgi:PKD repeat protein
MKILKILLGVLLISSMALASNNVEIHINYPADTAYIGVSNKVEIWIENDQALSAFSLAFSFWGPYEGEIIWEDAFSPFTPENDAVGALNTHYAATGIDDMTLPDIFMQIGIYFPVGGEGTALPPNSARACYYKYFTIPAGENIGEICVDNYFLYPTGDWIFVEQYGNNYPPDYFGCVNNSTIDPNCQSHCFPIAEAPTPVADFTFEPDSGDAPLQVQFTDMSSYGPSSWLWYFGDGQTSMEQNPLHEYQNEGVYFPKLVVSNGTGSDSLTSSIPVTVTTAQQQPGIHISCPSVKETIPGITDTISYFIEYTGTGTDDFVLTVNDSQGWFLSPTYLQFSLEENGSRTVKVMVIVPESAGIGTQNQVTAVVTSQSNPSVNDMATCTLEIVGNICGDVNLDGVVNVSDAVYIINYIFISGPSPCESK